MLLAVKSKFQALFRIEKDWIELTGLAGSIITRIEMTDSKWLGCAKSMDIYSIWLDRSLMPTRRKWGKQRTSLTLSCTEE